MLREAPLSVVVAAVVMLLLLIPSVIRMPSWWRGTSEVTPENPPLGWPMSAAYWRRMSLGMTVGVPMMGFASLAILFSHVSTTFADVLAWLAVALSAVWLSVILFARPRFLIPPTWRPDRKDPTATAAS